MDMNVSKYMAFVRTAESKSFTKAAKELNYSQSAVSRMINDLEKEWGITVLQRSKSGVSLTSGGIKIFPYAKALCEEYRKLQMQVDELNGLESGIIRIGVFSSVATHWLPNIIKKFEKDYPNIDYEMLLGDYTEIENWILNGRVDFGFLRLPVKSELDTVFIEQDPLVAVLPENHHLLKKKTISLSDVCNEPFLMLKKGENSNIEKIFKQSGLTPNVKFTTWDDYAIMSMVEGGLGVSILPKLILRRIPYNVKIKEFDTPLYRNIAIAVKDKKSIPISVKKFLNYIDYR